jgi:kynurenine formamidase
VTNDEVVPVHSGKRHENMVLELLEAIRTEGLQVIDLTHAMDEHSPYWPAGRERSPFTARVTVNFDLRACFARDLTLPEHFGTHLDAPAHALPGRLTVDQLRVARFLSAACVVDVREAVQANADYLVSVADLERHAERHGALPADCFVFFCTGWASRWPSQARYINEDAQGVKHLPGVSEQAARYLLDRVRPSSVGIDTPSVEGGTANDMAVHRALLGADLYILENLANLEQLPPAGAAIVALPLKLTGGSGSPARVLALVPGPAGVEAVKKSLGLLSPRRRGGRK